MDELSEPEKYYFNDTKVSPVYVQSRYVTLCDRLKIVDYIVVN